MSDTGRDFLRLEPGPNNAITDVPGIEVGHFTHDHVLRGVTALLCREGGAAGVSVRGGNPGTYNTDAFGPTTTSDTFHAIGLTGGSLFGLAAIAGIGEWLFENGTGMRWGDILLPIVAGAVIFDLQLTDPTVIPTAGWGRKAAAAARSGPFARGSIGAGRGGTAGKGPGCVKTKGGLGTASLLLPGEIVVGALVVINSLGGLIHPLDGRLYLAEGGYDDPLLFHMTGTTRDEEQAPRNTTIGIVATNAELDKPQLIKVADLAHNGLARAIRPMHTMLDGDTIFAVRPYADAKTLPRTSPTNLTDLVGAAAADAMALACLDAANQTEGIEGWPSVKDAVAAIRSPG
jgi:L-aminopeptidase/D-esterase-like protein